IAYGEEYVGERRAMVRDQLQARGITDPRVLQAMQRVPRHPFVVDELRKQAYEDHPIEIGFGQTISQPFMVARMAELAEPTLVEQLKEGGRLIIPVGQKSTQHLTVVRRRDTTFTVEQHDSCRFVDLVGRYGWGGDLPPQA